MKLFRNSSLSIGLMLIISMVIVYEGRGDTTPHKKLNFDCETCHTTKSFSDTQFDHNDLTEFELTGRHQTAACRGCHNIEDFSGAVRECVSCHLDVHEAKNGADCKRCHSTNRWDVLDMFDIHAETDFPIIGRHVHLDCQNCHRGFPGNDLSHTDSRCVSCHQTDYLATQNPNHVAAAFSTDCELCHQMTGFRPALLPDHDPFFPIFAGSHRSVWNSCSSCHTIANNFSNFSCLTCHEHNQTDMDPGHGGIPGYAYASQSCYSCHPRGEAGQFGAHDAQYFPIYSGKHNATWDNCGICHQVVSDRTQFSCLNCHDHNQTDMGITHSGFPGYVYASADCYACHPTGTAGLFVDHDAQFFPIFSGKHSGKWTNCATCHQVPIDKTQFTCFDCHEHNQTKMDDTHSGESGYMYDSQFCYNCHPNGRKD